MYTMRQGRNLLNYSILFSHFHNKKANREILSTGLHSFLNNSSAGFQSLLVSDVLLVEAKHHLCLISGNGEGILYQE